MSTQDILLVIMAIALGPGMVIIIAAGLARFGGWRTLAATYPPQPHAEDADKRLGSLSLGGAARYNNAVVYHIDDTHLHLKMIPILPFHPRMSIPLVAIESIEDSWWKGWSRVQVGSKRLDMPTRVIQREIDARALLERDAEHQPTEPAVS